MTRAWTAASRPRRRRRRARPLMPVGCPVPPLPSVFGAPPSATFSGAGQPRAAGRSEAGGEAQGQAGTCKRGFVRKKVKRKTVMRQEAGAKSREVRPCKEERPLIMRSKTFAMAARWRSPLLVAMGAGASPALAREPTLPAASGRARSRSRKPERDRDRRIDRRCVCRRSRHSGRHGLQVRRQRQPVDFSALHYERARPVAHLLPAGSFSFPLRRTAPRRRSRSITRPTPPTPPAATST